MNAHIGGLTLHAARWLVNENAGIRQSKTLSLGSGSQQQRTHRGTHANADRRHVRADELYRVIYSQTGRD